MKYGLYQLYSNIYELKQIADLKISRAQIKEAWECIDQAHIRRLGESIPARLDACRDSRRLYTRYLVGAL